MLSSDDNGLRFTRCHATTPLPPPLPTPLVEGLYLVLLLGAKAGRSRDGASRPYAETDEGREAQVEERAYMQLLAAGTWEEP